MDFHRQPAKIQLRRSYTAVCVCCGERGIAVNNAQRLGALCGNCYQTILFKISTRTIYKAYKAYKRYKEILTMCLIINRCATRVTSSVIIRKVSDWL